MSLNITLTQKIEFVQVQEGGNISKDASGITWQGQVFFYNILNRPIGCPALRNIIERNRFVSITDLNTQAQSSYSKNYDDCTITEARLVRHSVLGTNWKTAMKAVNNDSPNAKIITMSDSDIDSLVTEILNNCIC